MATIPFENQHFHGNRLYMVGVLLFRTMLLYLIIRIISGLFFIPFYRWEILFVLMFIVNGYCFCRQLITVTLTASEIILKKNFSQPIRLNINENQIISYEEPSDSQWRRSRLYLRVIDDEKYTKDYHLRFFTKKSYSLLLSAIQANHISSKSVQERTETIMQDFREGYFDYQVPRQAFIDQEKHRIGKLFLCFALLDIIMLLLKGQMMFHSARYTWIFLFVAINLMLLYIPIEVIKMRMHKKQCPQRISRDGHNLTFDQMKFTENSIQSITITSPTVVSATVLPKQRYIIIKTDEHCYKYWLGSEACLSRATYENLCHEVEKIFYHMPSKIIYRQK